jgi:RNA polymerase sigma-70 factor, ECF subfamily
MATSATKMYESTDAHLIQLITAQSDYTAFEQLFHRYYGSLCRYAYTYVKAYDEAEEIVSDVFLKIWKNRDVLQIQSSISAYLVRSTRNSSIDRLRYLNRQRRKTYDLVGDFEANYASPSDMVIGEETGKLIEAAVEALTPQAKLIFRMSRDTGMTQADIAIKLNLSIKTVEAHMGRALKSLRESLRQQAVLAR